MWAAPPLQQLRPEHAQLNIVPHTALIALITETRFDGSDEGRKSKVKDIHLSKHLRHPACCVCSGQIAVIVHAERLLLVELLDKATDLLRISLKLCCGDEKAQRIVLLRATTTRRRTTATSASCVRGTSAHACACSSTCIWSCDSIALLLFALVHNECMEAAHVVRSNLHYRRVAETCGICAYARSISGTIILGGILSDDGTPLSS